MMAVDVGLVVDSSPPDIGSGTPSTRRPPRRRRLALGRGAVAVLGLAGWRALVRSPAAAGPSLGQPRAARRQNRSKTAVVDLAVVAPADEHGGAGGPDLSRSPMSTRVERPGEVDRRARGRSRGRPPAAPARTRPPRPSSRRPSTVVAAAASGRSRDRPVARGHRGSGAARPPRRGSGAAVVAADAPDVLLVLEDDAERLVDELRAPARRAPSASSAAAQSSVSAIPGTLVRSASRSRWTKPTTSRASRSGRLGHAGRARSRTPSGPSGSRSSGTGSGA